MLLRLLRRMVRSMSSSPRSPLTYEWNDQHQVIRIYKDGVLVWTREDFDGD